MLALGATFLAGCRAESDAVASAAPLANVPLLASDGLFYPPELWAVLEPSAEATAVRALESMTATSGADVKCPVANSEGFAELAESIGPGSYGEVEGAYLLSQADACASVLAALDADPATWWSWARSETSVRHLWMIARVITDDDKIATWVNSDKTFLGEKAASADLIQAEFACQLLRNSSADTACSPAADASYQARPSAPRDAAMLLAWAAHARELTVSTDDGLMDVAAPAAGHDDWVRYLLGSMARTEGQADEADRLHDLFDESRVTANGDVLEAPEFNGSVGATFRMLRYLDIAGGLDTELDGPARREVAATVQSRLADDIRHSLAGSAGLTILGETPATDQSADDLVAAGLKQTGTQDDLTTLESVLGWTEVAEYSAVLGVPLEVPEVADQVYADWEALPEADGALIALRFLLAATDVAEHAADATAVDQVATRLSTTLAGLDPTMVSSSLLFGGAVALQRALGESPFTADELATEMQRRHGDCRGGFDEFIREDPAPGGYCDLEASRYAALAASEIAPPYPENQEITS